MSSHPRRRIAESGAIALLVSSFLLAAARADEPGFRPIFNGKDLTGWRLGRTDLAGKTASDDGRFAVKDGVLVITGSKDTPPKMAEIDTVESYDGDFTLRLEFRASRARTAASTSGTRPSRTNSRSATTRGSARTSRSRATRTGTGTRSR